MNRRDLHSTMKSILTAFLKTMGVIYLIGFIGFLFIIYKIFAMAFWLIQTLA